MSAVSMTSFTPTGRPCSGPRGRSSSRARACAIAGSGSRCAHARSSPSRSSIRSRHSHELLRAHLPLGEQPRRLGRGEHPAAYPRDDDSLN